MQILRDAASYARSPPNLFQFAAAAKPMQRAACAVFAQEEVACPAEGLVRLRGVHVFLAKHLWHDGALLPDSMIDHAEPARLGALVAGRVAAGAFEEHRAGDRTDVLFAKEGAGNWGHLLADIAPKLLNLARAGLGPVRLHVPANGGVFLPVLADLAARLGLDAEFRVAARGELARFEEAVFLTPVARHGTRKSTGLRELRALLLAAYGSAGARRLFVARPPPTKRAIANHAEIAALFAGCGFTIVDPGRLGHAEQVRLFAQATHVAGSVGAGMANLLFAPATAEILLIDPGLCDFYFWDAANLIGQRFHWHFAGPVREYAPALARDPFRVDPAALLATLRTLGWTEGRSRLRGWTYRLRRTPDHP